MLVIGVAISLDVPKKLQLPSNPLCQSKWCYCPCGKRGATRGCDWPKFRKNLKDFFQDDICKKLRSPNLFMPDAVLSFSAREGGVNETWAQGRVRTVSKLCCCLSVPGSLVCKFSSDTER